MKTRTLMLLALGCGLAIMLAGAVFLFQLTQQDEVAAPTPLGEVVAVAEMSVVVESVAEVDGVLDVTVAIGGVSDADGALGFRLIASGRPVNAQPDGPDACGSTAPTLVSCHVYFDVSSADGTSRVLFYDRGDDRARWVLG